MQTHYGSRTFKASPVGAWTSGEIHSDKNRAFPNSTSATNLSGKHQGTAAPERVKFQSEPLLAEPRPIRRPASSPQTDQGPYGQPPDDARRGARSGC